MAPLDSVAKVKVTNQMETPVWVIITENQRHVIETRTRKIGETEFEEYYRMMVEGRVKAPIEGIPIDASYKQDSEFKRHLRQYYEEHKEEVYEWSGFIEAGELEIAPRAFNNLSRKGDEELYYLSIRTMEGRVVADAVPRSEPAITISANGHIVDDPPPRPPAIENGSIVYLVHGKNVVGDPQIARGWPCGTVGKSGGQHCLRTLNGKTLTNGAVVRIETMDRVVAKDGYHNMYSSDIGNVYYDKKSDNSKQQWKIMKTNAKSNSAGNTLHYGDKVQIASVQWSQANLGINGKWLQCVTDDSTVWTLSQKPS